MKSKEFINEGDDKNIDDVQANHPQVYRFMVERVGYMALNKQSSVEAYNTAGNHMVVVKIQPSAGLGNLAAGLDADGVDFKTMKIPGAGNKMLQGSKGAMQWTVTCDNVRGNKTETWRFSLPHADGEIATAQWKV